MQLLADAKQMRKFDLVAISTFAIPGLVLMENAGRGFVDALERAHGPVRGKRILVMCGKGNNGGDGFVIARHCANRGAEVTAVLLGRRPDVKGDAATNLSSVLRLAKAKGKPLAFSEVLSGRQLAQLRKADIVVDAIFGTGFSGAPRDLYKAAIAWINRSGSYVASVDIPSGIDASNGRAEGAAVCAALTVTMGLGKVGLYVGDGREHRGRLEIADISIPPSVFRADSQPIFRVEAADIRSILPPRPLTAHKYSAGKVFVLAGSRNFTGAPAMTAQSALRSGAGAVILGIPRSIQQVLARKLTEVILQPLDETADGTIAESCLGAIQEKIRWADVVAIGPGMSRNLETDRLIREIVSTCEKTLVVDADALTAIAGLPLLLRRRKSPAILTPHSGELSRLVGVSAAAIERDRVSAAKAAAKGLRSIVVLKGAPTVTALPGGAAFVNSTGNPGMATVGSGDVLTGVIAGIAAQGADAGPAAWGSVFIHGKAGDIAAERLGQRSILALDILDSLPVAYTSLNIQ